MTTMPRSNPRSPNFSASPFGPHICPLPFAFCLLISLFCRPEGRRYTFILALCLLPFALCFPSSALGQERPSAGIGTNPAKAVVQLLAVGPGAGEKKEECAATGFLVNEDGYILTNAHVVDDARRCLAASLRGKIVAKYGQPISRAAQVVSCDVVAVDEDHDLAILKTEKPLPSEAGESSLALSTSAVPDGTRVAVTGHPAFTWQPRTFQGMVVGRAALALNDRSNRQSDVLTIDIDLQRGASGSPVYLESGAVVGIVERKRPAQPAQTVAVPIGYAIRLLDLYGIRWHVAR